MEDSLRVYLVTARHVLEGTRSAGSELFARFNLRDGGSADVLCPDGTWITSDETDVAVAPIHGSLEVDWGLIPVEWFATDEILDRYSVGIGDDVLFTGLFSPFPGVSRNQPIYRFGRISLMPDEPIPIRSNPGDAVPTMTVDAYLAECRSWGGHSGSPAFVYREDWNAGVIVVTQPLPFPKPYLLGLVHGHYEIPQEIAFLGDILGSGNVSMNAGIAIIIPAQKIVDLLNEEALVKDREELVENVRAKQPMPTPDATTTPSPDAEPSAFTKGDFDETLRRATRRVEKPEG